MRIRLTDSRPLILAAALALAGPILLTGCGDSGQQASAVTGAPPPSVIAAPVSSKAIATQAEFVGRVTAIDRVDLQARVPGFLKEWHFTEGQPVSVGDALFQIEPEQYQAVVDQRLADLAMAEANAENAVAQYKRGQELLKSKTIAQSQVDELKAKAAVTKASIAQAQAALTAAELDLSYTRITAPVAGRLGLARYTVGSLVGPDSGPLATIVSGDPIYVDFPLTQRQLLEAKRNLKARGTDASGVVVTLRLPDGSLYDQDGRINFVDVTTNTSTDSVTVRAEMSRLRKVIGAELKAYTERVRDIETAAATVALRAHGIDLGEYPPVAVSMLVTQIARSLCNEAAIGMTEGHRELRELVERYLNRLSDKRTVAT